MSMSYVAGSIAIVLLLIGAGTSQASTSAPQRAYWVAHDEIDYLDNLPRRYSCDQLYYKYRDVLLRLGARPDMTIYTYGCTGSKAAAADRPHVDLTYSVPAPVPADLESNTTLRARLETVEIGAGNPRDLSASDCALLDDMRQTVLASISKDIQVRGSQCANGKSRAKPYSLFIETLIPMAPSGNAAAPGK